jgi:hypothetical protein
MSAKARHTSSEETDADGGDTLASSEKISPPSSCPARGLTDVLVPGERWCVAISRVPRAAAKIRALLFMATAAERAQELLLKFGALERASSALMECDSLVVVMQMVLAVGNQLNQGSSNGGAVGFTVASLLKLSQTKGVDRKTTILDYIVKTTADSAAKQADDSAATQVNSDVDGDVGATNNSYQHLLRLPHELLSSLRLAQYPATELLAEARSLESGMQQLKCVVGGASRDSRGARHIEFGEHFEKVTMADIHASAQKQKMDSKALSSYFGESSSNGSAGAAGPVVLEAMFAFLEQLRDSIKKNGQQATKQRRLLKAKRPGVSAAKRAPPR